MAERVKEFKGGPGGPRGPRPKIKNPGKVLRRIIGYVLKHYKVQSIVVVCCIVASVVCNLQGTWFMQTLIDGYILPMLQSGSTDFSGLLSAMARVACFYALGVAAAFTQARLMAYITQGTLKRLRDELFTHMQTLPVR